MAIENVNNNANNLSVNDDLNDDVVDDGAVVDDGSGSEVNRQDDGQNNNNQNKTFTQEQVNKMMTREKRQGRNAVYRELGIDPKDTRIIELLKSVLKNNLQSQEGNDDNKIAEAEQRALVAETKAQALQMGAQSNYVDDIVTLAMNKIKDDESDAAAVIGEIKTKYPAMFEQVAEEDKKKSAKAGTGSSVDAKGGSSKKTSGSLGQRLAQQRKGNNNNKNSFWA